MDNRFPSTPDVYFGYGADLAEDSDVEVDAVEDREPPSKLNFPGAPHPKKMGDGILIHPCGCHDIFHPSTKDIIYGAAGALVGSVAVYMLMRPRQKKISGTLDSVVAILAIGAIGVGGYLVWKYFLSGGGGGSTTTGGNNSGVAAAAAQSIANSIAAEKANGGFLSLTESQCAGIANNVYTMLATGDQSASNQDNIVNEVIQVNTLLDLLTVIQYFGTKGFNNGSWISLCAVAQVNCSAMDMPTALKNGLDQSHLQTINSFLSEQNINYQF